jgi:hypothetical protein
MIKPAGKNDQAGIFNTSAGIISSGNRIYFF